MKGPVLILLAATAFGQQQHDASAYFNRGLAALRSQNFAEAQALIKAGLQMDPNSAPGYDLLGIASAELGNYGDAEKFFRRAISLNPRFIGAHNDLARSLYRRGMIGLSIQEFRAALQLDPDNFTANFNLGLIHRERKEYAESIRYLQVAHRLTPSDVQTSLALAGAYFNAGKTQDGLALSREILSAHAGDPQLDLSLGTLLLEQKQYSDAAACLEHARVADPRNFDLLHNLGQAYTHLAKYDAAENAFLTALSLRAGAVETLYQLAVAYTQWGHADQAIQVLVRARALEPARPDVLLLLGRLCIQEGFIDDAIDVLQRAAAINPEKVEPHLLLGEAFTKRREYDKALAEYEVMAKLDPHNPQSYVSIGRTYEYLADYPEAGRALAKALAIDPKNTQAAYYMGRIAYDQDDAGAAKRWYGQVLALDPKNIAALYDMGVALMHEGNNVQARQYLQKAIEVEPSLSQLYYRLSIVERRLNHPQEAAQAFALFKKYDVVDRQRRENRGSGILDFVKETQSLPETERLQRYRDALLKTAETRPDDLNLLFLQAQVYFRLGEEAQALETVARISSLEPDNTAVHMRSASLLTRFNYFTEAADQLRSALEKHPDSGEVRFALASLYYRMRRFADARTVLPQRSIRSAGYHNLLGRILVEEADTSRGLDELRQAVSLEPNNENYTADLAIELAAAGQAPKALALLANARANNAAGVHLLLAEGMCHQLAGDYVSARKDFEKAAELALDSELPYLAEANLLRERGDRGRAAEILDRAAVLFPDSPWPHWFKALASGPAEGHAELQRALDLAQAQPAVYPALIAGLLRTGDCRHATEVWDRMKPLGLSPDLDPSRWCGEKVLPDYPEWRWIVELARE
jgi:tetratricopeptide (TPR) repeat protein